jgi:very-short-patch-repair endonuclease
LSKLDRQPDKRRLREFAKAMRRSPTDAEAKMWRLLRDRRLASFKFRRQVPFQSYILDFVCFEKRLVVEVDGGQHAESLTDPARDRRLIAEGFQIARYWNNDVLQEPSVVLEDLFTRLTQS